MAKQSKSTKKFEKNRLKATIDRRKEFAKVKQRHQLKEKKKHRAAQRRKAEDHDGDSDDETAEHDEGDMNEDEFFQNEDNLGADMPRVPPTGKRKHTAGAEEVEESSASGDEDDLGHHKDQLASLAVKDPEFYQFLQANDAELLDFDEDDDLGAVDALSDEGPPLKRQKTQSSGDGPDDVTMSMVKKWSQSLSAQFSIRALRQLVLAFRAAAHADDEDELALRYNIASPEVYHEVLMTALKQVPAVLAHHLPVREMAGSKVRVPTDTAKFKTLAPLIKSHASSVHYLLGHLSDTNTLRLTLQSFEPLLAYLLEFRKFIKVIIKTITSIWSENSSDEATRVSAFLILRRLMVLGDAGIREAVLKSSYEGLVKGSRNTTFHTLAGINLMKNSAAELWGLDEKVGYTTGFTFIRQLAIHLRGNITKPTKDSYKTIYNWQFVHSLDFWSRVLSMHCNSLAEAQNGKPSPMRPLIYPAVQVTLGVMRLIPTSTYFPLRFQLMRSLLRVSQATETYIPLAAALLEVLNAAEMRSPAKAATLRPLDFTTHIRAPTSYLKTKVYQDGVGEQVAELLSEFLVLWTKSIAYPELQLPAMVMLKRWLKTASQSRGNKNGKLNQSLLLVVQKSEANARWIEERRNTVTFAPKNRTEVEAFLKETPWQETPLGAFVVGQRKVREERQRVVEQGRKGQERRGAGRDDEDDQMDDIVTAG